LRLRLRWPLEFVRIPIPQPPFFREPIYTRFSRYIAEAEKFSRELIICRESAEMKSDLFKHLLQKLFCFILTVSVLAGAFPAAGQTRRGTAAGKGAANTSNSSAALAGWTGIVTYKKILHDSFTSDEPVFGRVDEKRNRVKHEKSRDYIYEGRLIVDGNNPAQPVTKATVSFTDEDTTKGHQVEVDSCHAFNDEHEFIDDSTDQMIYKASATGPADGLNINASFEESRNYHFSFRFPEAVGTYSREQHVTHKGYCQPKNNEPVDLSQSDPTKVEGETVSIDGQFDPTSPNAFSGSSSWGGLKTGAVKQFYYEVSWRFTRKPVKLLVTDLRFEEMKFPNWNEWREMTYAEPAVDGNIIKIKAKVLNMSDETKYAEVQFKETYKGDRWDESKPDALLKDGTASVRLDAGEEREVEVLWDSEGYAWYDDGGRPREMQRIKAEAWEDNKLKDSLTQNLNIAPKPLILVPGIWSNANSLEVWQNYLTEAHGRWRDYIVGAKGQGQTSWGTKTNSVYDNADELAKYINFVRNDFNAWHVDLVAHSNAGLAARLYVHKQMDILPDNRPVAKHLVMLGTPNNGLPCEEALYHQGEVFESYPKLVKELTQENINLFNQYVTNRKGTRFSALIGNALPSLCPGDMRNDGFISVDSAKFGITDYGFTNDGHRDLIDVKHFGEFIRPHLVTGPRGTYPLTIVSGEGGKDGRSAQ
jgi:pimeloyl-ACP methyl ester carboxylesterase